MIAALGKTLEATRGYSIMATLIMVMLGGAWVPTFVLPQWLQKSTVIVPTRWAMDGLDAMTWRPRAFRRRRTDHGDARFYFPFRSLGCEAVPLGDRDLIAWGEHVAYVPMR